MSSQVSNSQRGPSTADRAGAPFLVGATMNTFDPLSGKIYPSWMVAAVDQLMVKIRHMDIWEVVDICLDIWAKRNPKEYKAFLDDMKRYRATRANQYGATKSRVWRELIVIPPLVNFLLYKLAKHKIEEYGEDKFRRDFSKRYTALRPGEKY